jgi:hypothetical protein
MKKIFILFLLLVSFSLYAQDVQEIKFFANDGAFQINEVTCKSFDTIYKITVNIPVPDSIATFDCFFIHLTASTNLHAYFSKTYKHDEIMLELAGEKSITLTLFESGVFKSDFEFYDTQIKFECRQEKLKGDPWEIIEIEAKPMNAYSTYNGDPLYSGNVYCKGQLIIRKPE